MKGYRETKAYKIRQFLRAYQSTPDASAMTLGEIARIARNTAAAYRDHIVDLGLQSSDLLSLSDTELLSAMARRQWVSELHPIDEEEVKLLRKKGHNKGQCYERYLMSVPPGGIPMSLRTFRNRLQKSEEVDPAMKLVFVAGDVLMADYAGDKPKVRSPFGHMHEYSIFVATLACSQRITAYVHEFQRIEDWIDGFVDAIHDFGGVSRRLVPDNPKALVIRPRVGNTPAVLHPAFEQLCDHYQCVGDPARAGKPNDKSLVEIAVKLIQQELSPALALRPEIDLQELKELLSGIVAKLNSRPMEKRQNRSRMDWFYATDHLALRPISMARDLTP